MTTSSNKIIACRVEHCLGCRSCEIACALAHSRAKDLVGAAAEHPRPQSRVTVEMAGSHGLPLQCRHCEDGLCQVVCPTGAIHRDEARGLTVVDEDLCIGCKLCTLMCPMGVLKIGEGNRATIKCDQCADRQAQGDQPACVAACPTHALQFVDRGDVAAEGNRLTAVSVVTEAGVACSRGRLREHESGAGENMPTPTAAWACHPAGEKPATSTPRRVVVIGASAAGAMAAIHAAQAGAEVTLVSADVLSYRRPAIPALIAGQMESIDEARIYSPETFAKHGIRVVSPAIAETLDTTKKTVRLRTADGAAEDLPYDAAVLAVGGTALRPKIPGADKRGVCTFTTAEGALEILRVAGTARAAVVVGASFVALEVAQALMERGLKVYFNVRSRILRRMMEPDLSAYLQDRFAQRGLEMLAGEEISEIGGGEAVEYVVHKGVKIPADLVVLGAGVGPNVMLARAAGLKLGASGAVAVDGRMQTSAPDVYAAGDCAEAPDFSTGRAAYSAVGSTGALAGAIAGTSAAGGDAHTDGFLRAQADEILGLQVYSIGHSTTTAADVGLAVTAYDLPTPPEVERARDEIRGHLLTDAAGRIVGAQAVAFHHGSQYAWQLYQAVLAGEPREAFLKRWMSPRRRAAKLAEQAWGELVVKSEPHS